MNKIEQALLNEIFNMEAIQDELNEGASLTEVFIDMDALVFDPTTFNSLLEQMMLWTAPDRVNGKTIVVVGFEKAAAEFIKQ